MTKIKFVEDKIYAKLKIDAIDRTEEIMEEEEQLAKTA